MVDAISIQGILNKCKEEVEWAQANIDEMNENDGYCEEDKTWLPCWLKAHEEMIKFINEEGEKL